MLITYHTTIFRFLKSYHFNDLQAQGNCSHLGLSKQRKQRGGHPLLFYCSLFSLSLALGHHERPIQVGLYQFQKTKYKTPIALPACLPNILITQPTCSSWLGWAGWLGWLQVLRGWIPSIIPQLSPLIFPPPFPCAILLSIGSEIERQFQLHKSMHPHMLGRQSHTHTYTQKSSHPLSPPLPSYSGHGLPS